MAQTATQKAFKDGLSADSLKVFNEAAKKSFSQQAVFFLNAFWKEYGHFAEYIFSVCVPIMRMADMNAKGVQYVHLYDEGDDLDFDMGLYFFEQLCVFNDNPTHEKFGPMGLAKWSIKNPNFRLEYQKMLPEMMSSLPRKKELRDTVDVNFDGRISMLEFLLYQTGASPIELMDRSMGTSDIHPEIKKALAALAEVRASVKAYESKKHTFTEGSKLPGVKGLRFKNQLAQLDSSPEWDRLNKALITAEAAVRIVTRKFGNGQIVSLPDEGEDSKVKPVRTDGTVWWMNRELQEQQEKYGKKKK